MTDADAIKATIFGTTRSDKNSDASRWVRFGLRSKQLADHQDHTGLQSWSVEINILVVHDDSVIAVRSPKNKLLALLPLFSFLFSFLLTSLFESKKSSQNLKSPNF